MLLTDPQMKSISWHLSENAVLALTQHARVDCAERTFFNFLGRKYSVSDATSEVFLFFLRQYKIDVLGYSEFPLYPALARCPLLCNALQRGKLRLLQLGNDRRDKNTLFFLVPSTGCHDLAEQERWDTALCCPDCHDESGALIEHIMGDRSKVMVCCRANRMIDDYPGGDTRLSQCEFFGKMDVSGDDEEWLNEI
jgi:hypothetical protein